MATSNQDAAAPSPRVVLIEDETVFRQLLKRSLEKRKGWKHVEDYSNGAIGLEACMDDPPDLLLVDLQLPGKHGLDIVAELIPAHPEVKVLVLTGHAEPQLPAKLMRLGVAGFVDKTAPLAYVIQAIDTVMAGGMFLHLTWRRKRDRLPEVFLPPVGHHLRCFPLVNLKSRAW